MCCSTTTLWGAQDKLISAMHAMQAKGVEQLVLDMRYNSGGYLYIAQTLASMLSGQDAVGQVFESLRFNDKRDAESQSSAFNFGNTVQYAEASYPAGYVLPKLSLRRLYVLSSEETCSASESIINGLRGIDIEVVLIGATTCGKPYGFTRKDNCGRAYFPIEFQGTNAKGFGDYNGGFAPSCSVNDDLEHGLGHTNETQLAGALHHMDTGQCLVSAVQRSWLQTDKPTAMAWAIELARPPHGRLLRH